MGRLDNGRNNRNSRDSFSNERTGRRSGAYRKSRTDSSKSKKRKLEKEEVLTKKQIREAEKDGDPLWMREPDKYQKQAALPIRILKSVGSVLATLLLIFGIVGVLVLSIGATIVYSYSNPELLSQLDAAAYPHVRGGRPYGYPRGGPASWSARRAAKVN